MTGVALAWGVQNTPRMLTITAAQAAQGYHLAASTPVAILFSLHTRRLSGAAELLSWREDFAAGQVPSACLCAARERTMLAAVAASSSTIAGGREEQQAGVRHLGRPAGAINTRTALSSPHSETISKAGSPSSSSTQAELQNALVGEREEPQAGVALPDRPGGAIVQQCSSVYAGRKAQPDAAAQPLLTYHGVSARVQAHLWVGGKSHRLASDIQAGQEAPSSSSDFCSSIVLMVAIIAMLSRLYCALRPYTCNHVQSSAHGSSKAPLCQVLAVSWLHRSSHLMRHGAVNAALRVMRSSSVQDASSGATCPVHGGKGASTLAYQPQAPLACGSLPPTRPFS